MFLDCSYGFRPGRSVAHAVEQVIRYRDANLCWVVDADIKKCFDNIDPKILMRLVRKRLFHPQVLIVVESWLKVPIFNTADGRPAQAGVSQGSALAPLLCNIYLHELDVALSKQGIAVVRYADDFVTQSHRKKEAQQAYRAIEQALARLRLQLHPKKTRLVHFDQGFQFLGHFFVRNNLYRL